MTETGAPKVSVCLMTYNGATTVERALATLLAQTYRDYEIVLSDDHSTDDTLAICERLAVGHPNVRFVRPERNLGAYNNMQFALAQARGRYFLWACQDDYWEPQFLAAMVDAIEQTPGALCAQGRVRWISKDEDRSEILRLQGRDLPERQSPLTLAASLLTGRSRNSDAPGRKKVLKSNIFMHGLWLRDAFAAALVAHVKPFRNERQILCQLALAGKFRYVDRLLMHKMRQEMKLKDRYPATDATLIAKSTESSVRELFDTLAGIFRSPLVGSHLKMASVPLLGFNYFRHRLNQRKFMSELAPALWRKAFSSARTNKKQPNEV